MRQFSERQFLESTPVIYKLFRKLRTKGIIPGAIVEYRIQIVSPDATDPVLLNNE